MGELDGVRLISSRLQELLQEVPLVCQDIFKIASMAPGALLLEAHREYEVGQRWPTSDNWSSDLSEGLPWSRPLPPCRSPARRPMST